MYKSFKMLIMTVNTKGGENETVEHLYKEVDGKLVPKTEEEAKLYLLDTVSKTGGNASTQAIKGMLFDTKGDLIKIEEIIKPIVNTKQFAIENAIANYKANPTDENLAKIKEVVTAE